MRKNEKAFLSIIVIGFILELSQISWGNMVMMVGIGLLANTYLFGFTALINNVSYQEFSKNRADFKNNSIHQLLPPYAILTLMIGMLFKFKAWPGGNLILVTGLILLGFAFYLLFKNKTITKTFKSASLKRMLITGLFAIVFYALPNFFWFEIINRDRPAYIEATKRVYEDPENEVYRQQLEDELKKKDDGL
jgi:4-amino-4-deoxy-L-arabinose transferase-like glycosyltransferase